MSAADWEFNVHRAQRVLAGKKHLTGPWTALEVARKLVRGGRLCGGRLFGNLGSGKFGNLTPVK